MEERPLSELLAGFDDLESQRRELAKATGSVIRSARKSASISQSDLAEAAGVTQAYVSQVENGKRSVSSDTFNAFRGAFSSLAEGETHGQDHTKPSGKEDARKARQSRARK